MTRYFILLFSIFISTLVVSSQIPENDPVSLKTKGDNYLIENSYDSAVVYYNKAATGFLREADIKEYLYCKNQEAYVLGFQNKNREALTICKKILEEYPDSLKAYRLDVYFFWKMALFSVRIGDFGVAYTYGEKTKETAESYSIFEGYMLNDVLDILTTSTRYIGLYDVGLEYAFEKIKYCQSVGDYLNLSHSYNNIALIYKRLFDHNRALEYFMKSRELREKYAPQWTPYVTTNIGEMYQESGNADSAITWFQNTLRILKDQGVRENLLYSAVYSSMSVALAKEENFDSAKFYIDKSLDIRSRYFSTDDIHYTNFQLTKTEILINSGDLTSAFNLLKQLEEVYTDESLSPQDRSRYQMLVADYYKSDGRINEALLECQKAIIILSRDFEEMDILKLPGLNDLFYGKDAILRAIILKTSLVNDLYIKTGDLVYLRSVSDHYKFSLELINLMIEDQSGMESVSALYRDFSKLYETAIMASVSLDKLEPGERNYSDISSYMEASRMNHAKILYRMNQVVNYGGIPDSVLVRKSELEGLIASIADDSVNDTTQYSGRFILEQELDRIQLLLKNEKSNMALLQNEDFDLLRESQVKLKRRGMILQYYFGEGRLYLLATMRSTNRLISLPWSDNEKKDLDSFIGKLRGPGYDSSMVTLNDRIFTSLGLDSVLSNEIDEIIVIPDRELHFVPFDALRDSNHEFLISNYTIYTENSLFFMNVGRKRTRKSISMIGLAPFIDRGDQQGIQEAVKRYGTTGLYPLPGSGDEVKNIGELFGGIIRTGSDATEEFFRENAGESGIIHLSSHSYLNDSDPLFNSIILAPGTGDQDGSLFVHELYSMNLEADLVTLSACNTGIGRYLDGEGMISLATGFRSAGVRNIVMSLWSLPDNATSEVMVSFYKYLKGGTGMAEALRNAKLDYLASADINASSPYFWAASVLTGSNEPLHLNRVKFSTVVILFTGCLMLVFIAIWVRRKSRR